MEWHSIFIPWVVAGLSSLGTWVVNVLATAMITSLPAPTKDSTTKYVYWFRVLNKVVGAWERSANTHLESSPNFPDVSRRLTNGNIKHD